MPPDRMCLKGLVNPAGVVPSFLVPVFGDADTSWLQDAEYGSDVVSRFLQCQTPPSLIAVEDRRDVRIGDQVVYAFVLVNHSISIGTAKELRTLLRAQMATFEPYPFIQMDVASFLGDEVAHAAAARRAADLPTGRDGAVSGKPLADGVGQQLGLDRGSRVLHLHRPENGFGIVRYVEEDVLGGERIQVDFENLVSLQTVPPDELALCPDFDTPAQSCAMSDTDAVLRRILCGAVIGETTSQAPFFMRPHSRFLTRLLPWTRFLGTTDSDIFLRMTLAWGRPSKQAYSLPRCEAPMRTTRC